MIGAGSGGELLPRPCRKSIQCKKVGLSTPYGRMEVELGSGCGKEGREDVGDG